MAKGIEKWTTERNLKKIEKWREDGLSASQLAEKMGISRSTLYSWLKENPDILDAYTRGGGCADAEVINMLYQRCIGYTKTVKKPQKIRQIEYNEDGKKIKEYDEVIFVDEEIYVPPDTAAQKFWLTNRDSGNWKAESKIEVTAKEIDEGGVVMLPEVKEIES